MKKRLLIITLFILFLALPVHADFMSDLIVTGTSGIWTDSRAYSTLADCITDVGASEVDIYIAKQEAVTALTIPATARLHFLKSGSIANTGQLTLNTKQIFAGDQQIFTGTGDIDFSPGSVIRSSWFSTIVTAFTLTNDDNVTLIISKPAFITASCAVGDNVNLKWEAPNNRLTANAGFTLSNIKNIEAGNFQLFAGAGTFTFLDGVRLDLSWFARLRSALTWIDTTEATLEFSGTHTVDYTDTVPTNITLKSSRGMLSIVVGQTLTINGTFESDLRHVFTGDGTVTFGIATKEVFPQWFGALGNGVQDDTSMIQAAIDSIATGVLRIPAGHYILNSKTAYTSANDNSTLYGQIILNNDISIKGDGLSSQLHCTLDDTFYATVVVNGTNHSIIEGLYILGTGTAWSSNYGGGIRVELSGKTVVRDNYIKSTRGIAINYVGNLGGNVGSTEIDYYCAYTHTDNNTIEDCNGDGIYHIFSKYNTISNNTLDNVGYTDAIILEASDHSTVNGNIILYPNQRGILINTGSSYSNVNANTLYHQDATTVYDSIYLASVRHCIVSNNMIRYDTAGANPKSAIVMIPGDYNYVDTYHQIIGNQIYNAGGSMDITAIHVQTDYNTIQGNKINVGTYGISVDAADYNVIQGNDLRTDGGQEIRLVGIDGRANPTYTYISNNYIQTSVLDSGTNTYWHNNFPSESTLTTGSPQLLSATDRWRSVYKLDSSGGAITGTLKDGTTTGQFVTIVMTNATTSSTISVEHHVTSDPEVGTFDAVDEVWVLQWTGTEWQTVGTPTCTFN